MAEDEGFDLLFLPCKEKIKVLPPASRIMVINIVVLIQLMIDLFFYRFPGVLSHFEIYTFCVRCDIIYSEASNTHLENSH